MDNQTQESTENQTETQTQQKKRIKHTRLKQGRHPLDSIACFNSIFLSFLSPIIKNAKSLKQNTAKTDMKSVGLPPRDKVSKAKTNIINSLYSKGVTIFSPPSQIRKLSKEKENKEKNPPPLLITQKVEAKPPNPNTLTYPKFSLTRAFLGWNKCRIAFFCITQILLDSITFLKLYAINRALEIINEQLYNNQKLVNRDEVLIWFSVILLGSLVQEIGLTLQNLREIRLKNKLIGGLYGTIYQKMLKIPQINANEHNQDSICQLYQSEIPFFTDFVPTLRLLVSSITCLALSVVFGVMFFHIHFLGLILGIGVLGVLNACLSKGLERAEKRTSYHTEVREKDLKKILSNIKLIKIMALENNMLLQICAKRAVELRASLQAFIIRSILNLVLMFGNSFIVVLFLLTYLNANLRLSVSLVTILLKLFELLRDSLEGIRSSAQFLSESETRAQKLEVFVESKQVENGVVIRGKKSIHDFVVEIKNGSFLWDKKINPVEAACSRMLHLKTRRFRTVKKKGRKKSSNGQNQEAIPSSLASELRRTLLTEAPSEGTNKMDDEEQLENQDTRKTSFTFTNVNFKAERGHTTAILGSLNSGRSSLLLSIFGEMRVVDYNRTEVKLDGRIGFASQNLWILNGSLKSNIIMNKKFDQDLFDSVIKSAALQDELIKWEDTEDTLIGESGMRLTNCQKARIALARCLYQR